MGLLQIITLFGSLVGLATGIFVLIDRFLWYRPVVTWFRHEHNVGVSIKNVAQEHILVQSIQVSPKKYALAWSDNVHDTIDAAANIVGPLIEGKPMRLASVLGPSAIQTYHLVRGGSASCDDNVRVRVNWRFCRNRWMPQLPVTLRAMRSLLDEIENARVKS